MPTDLREHDVRRFLERMAGEMPTPPHVPPPAMRRARRKLARTVIASVLVAALAAVGSLSGVRALLRAEPPRPADNSSKAIVATIPVRGEPVHVAVGEGFVWVAGDSVSKVDPATNQVVATQPSEPKPEGSDAGPVPRNEVDPTYPSVSRREGSAIAVGEGAVWVSGGEFDGELLRIDPDSGALAGFHAGDGYRDPYAVAVGAGSAWVTNDRAGTLRQVDVSAVAEEDAIRTIELPRLHAYGVTFLEGMVWVVAKDVDGDPGELIGVDAATGAIVATFPVGVFDEVRAGFGALWASGPGSGAEARVLRIDPATGGVLATAEVAYADPGSAPGETHRQRIAVGEGAVWVAVTDRSGDGSARGRILRIDPDTNQVVGEVAVETPAAGIAAGAGAVWVTDGLGTLYRIDPEAVLGASAPPFAEAPPPPPSDSPTVGGPVVAAIPVGGFAYEMALGEGGVWVTDDESGVLVKVDPVTNAVVATLDFGVSENDSSVAVGEGSVWIASEQDGAIFRVDPGTNEVVATLPYYGGTISAGAGNVWVIDYGDEGPEVIGIDPTTDPQAAVTSLGGGPSATAERPVEADGILWTVVDRAATGDLVGIDPTSGEIVRRFQVEDARMHGLAAGFGSLWVPSSGGRDGHVLRLDPSTGAVLASIDVPAVGEGGLALAVGEDAVWVSLTDREGGESVRGRLVRIDPATNAITGEIVVGRAAARVAAGYGAVWVTDGLGTLYRIDPSAFGA